MKKMEKHKSKMKSCLEVANKLNLENISKEFASKQVRENGNIDEAYKGLST